MHVYRFIFTRICVSAKVITDTALTKLHSLVPWWAELSEIIFDFASVVTEWQYSDSASNVLNAVTSWTCLSESTSCRIIDMWYTETLIVVVCQTTTSSAAARPPVGRAARPVPPPPVPHPPAATDEVYEAPDDVTVASHSWSPPPISTFMFHSSANENKT